jgi:outer membrane protein assembly factor BamE (lipoprotein component of BamABCDE complex)
MERIWRLIVRLTIGVFLIVLGLSLGYDLSQMTRVTPKNLARIQQGMSDSEVYTVIGRPHEKKRGDVPEIFVTREIWYSAEVNISVEFDKDRRVTKAGGSFDVEARPSIMTRVKEIVGLK